jgi:hypothetical protein
MLDLSKLNEMIGMKDLKENILDQILYFIQDLHKGVDNNYSGDFMHTVIYGPPGTGKTEIAKIMGKSDILSYEDLIIPVAKTYNLDYSVWGSCSYEEYLTQSFDSYDEDWVIDSANQQREDGNWDLYDGRIRSEATYDNFEESDHSFDRVYEVNDNKIKESLLDRLVLENTSEVVSSLDKQTLLKLKQIIESRLRSL